MPTFEEIAQRFAGPHKQTVKGVMVRCPAHEDHTPSLHLLRGDRCVGLVCFAGCDKSAVMRGAGLSWDDIFYEPLPPHHGPGQRPQPTRVLDMVYEYQRLDGTVHMTVERWSTDTGGKTFRQRASGLDHLPEGFKPCLYNLPTLTTAITEGQEVWIVEGEKDVETLRYFGLSATTAPMGAGKWQPYYWHWLRGAVSVVVVADADDVGYKHAAMIADDLTGHGLNVRCVRAKWGKDATDHFRKGYGAEDFVAIDPHRSRPLGLSMAALMSKHFDPVRWTVPGILGPGLALLGGPPKQGKSWLALDIALGVACGGVTMSQIACVQGDVLYLSLDNDSERRLQDRAAKLMGERLAGDLPVEFHVQWPTGADALHACREWVYEVPNPRLIVVDTYVRAEPDFDSSPHGSTAYSHSTDVLSRWAKLANDAGITILGVHHDRKQGFEDAGDGDWINRFTGSRGITASASTLLFLDAKRGAREGTLHLTGRDVGDFDIPMVLSRPFWIATDLPPEAQPMTQPEVSRETLGADASEPTYEGLHAVPDFVQETL